METIPYKGYKNQELLKNSQRKSCNEEILHRL